MFERIQMTALAAAVLKDTKLKGKKEREHQKFHSISIVMCVHKGGVIGPFLWEKDNSEAWIKSEVPEVGF